MGYVILHLFLPSFTILVLCKENPKTLHPVLTTNEGYVQVECRQLLWEIASEKELRTYSANVM
jgi:hypothetical protein